MNITKLYGITRHLKLRKCLEIYLVRNVNSDEKPDTYQDEKIHLLVQIIQSNEQHWIMVTNLMQQLLNIPTC